MKILFVILALAACAATTRSSPVANNDTQTPALQSPEPQNHLDDQPQPHLRRKPKYIIWTRVSRIGDNLSEACSSSLEDFPYFPHDAGMIVVVFLIGIYCFTLLAIICDSYFLPCVEKICEALNLSHDVAAATFMSVATSTPELFVNIIGTFITESDIGIGTVVGSSMFNTLGVASLGGLAAASPVQLHWWPVTRDVVIYIASILILVAITWDGLIYWYEGLVLFLIYFVYFTVMFQNTRISRLVEKLLRKFHKKDNKVATESAVTRSTVTSVRVASKMGSALNSARASCATPRRGSLALISTWGSYAEEPVAKFIEPEVISEEGEVEEESLFRIPKGSFWKKAFFFYTWPLKFLLFCTIPDPQRFPKLFPVTFIFCIFYIGSNSYLVSWMITIIGNIFSIPDAVLGLTFLAAGGCLPEAISITIMSRRGEGSMGVSNSLGANTMNILLSLGMPWFLKTILVLGTDTDARIDLTSGSIEYTILALVVVALILYLSLYFNKFRLSRKLGVILLSVYLICVSLAILAELVFFESDCNKV